MPVKLKNLALGSDEEESGGASAGAMNGLPGVRRVAAQQVRITMLPTTQVDFDPSNPRSGDLPDVDKLAASIRQKGLLQPIGVVAGEDDRYICKFGNRRLAAFKRLARSEQLDEAERSRYQAIPAIVVTVARGDGTEEAILSNTQIVALSAEDKARAFQRLHQMGYTDNEIGELFNLTRQMVNTYRNNAEALANGLTIYEVQHPQRSRSKQLSDNRTASTPTYWASQLIERAAKGRLAAPRNADERSTLLELRILIDEMLREKLLSLQQC